MMSDTPKSYIEKFLFMFFCQLYLILHYFFLSLLIFFNKTNVIVKLKCSLLKDKTSALKLYLLKKKKSQKKTYIFSQNVRKLLRTNQID